MYAQKRPERVDMSRPNEVRTDLSKLSSFINKLAIIIFNLSYSNRLLLNAQKHPEFEGTSEETSFLVSDTTSASLCRFLVQAVAPGRQGSPRMKQECLEAPR